MWVMSICVVFSVALIVPGSKRESNFT